MVPYIIGMDTINYKQYAEQRINQIENDLLISSDKFKSLHLADLARWTQVLTELKESK